MGKKKKKTSRTLVSVSFLSSSLKFVSPTLIGLTLITFAVTMVINFNFNNNNINIIIIHHNQYNKNNTKVIDENIYKQNKLTLYA